MDKLNGIVFSLAIDAHLCTLGGSPCCFGCQLLNSTTLQSGTVSVKSQTKGSKQIHCRRVGATSAGQEWRHSTGNAAYSQLSSGGAALTGPNPDS